MLGDMARSSSNRTDMAIIIIKAQKNMDSVIAMYLLTVLPPLSKYIPILHRYYQKSNHFKLESA